MEPLVQRALEIQETRNHPEAAQLKRDLRDIDQSSDNSWHWAKIVGVGGAGSDITDNIYRLDPGFARIVAVDTDKQHLNAVRADKKILIGKSLTRGLGAGGFPGVSRRAAELARSTFQEEFKLSDVVFLIAGRGGGTGTGAAPVIAEIAKECGCLVISIVVLPSGNAGSHGLERDEEIEELQSVSDTLILLDNERLRTYIPGLPLEPEYLAMDQLISEVVYAIIDMIERPQLVHTDLGDLWETVKAGKGLGALLYAECNWENRVEEVARKALNCQFCDADYRKAAGMLVILSHGSDVGFREYEQIISLMSAELGEDTHIVWGTCKRPDYEGKIKVTALLTGLGRTLKDAE